MTAGRFHLQQQQQQQLECVYRREHINAGMPLSLFFFLKKVKKIKFLF